MCQLDMLLIRDKSLYTHIETRFIEKPDQGSMNT